MDHIQAAQFLRRVLSFGELQTGTLDARHRATVQKLFHANSRVAVNLLQLLGFCGVIDNRDYEHSKFRYSVE